MSESVRVDDFGVVEEDLARLEEQALSGLNQEAWKQEGVEAKTLLTLVREAMLMRAQREMHHEVQIFVSEQGLYETRHEFAKRQDPRELINDARSDEYYAERCQEVFGVDFLSEDAGLPDPPLWNGKPRW